MKKTRKIMALFLACVLCVGLLVPAAAAGEEKTYTVVNPYADVVWEGDGAWGAYKGNLHSHTTYSDADESLAAMVKEYYEQGFDFLANSDHGATGVEWNQEPTRQILYSYNPLIGKEIAHLTDEEYEAITSGSYPLASGSPRGNKMVCVTGANELNNLTLTKCHVNGYFLPDGVGDGFGGSENGYEQAIQLVQENGGLSHINHPGDLLDSNKDISQVSKPWNVRFFSELLLKYPTCLGIEVFNDRNSTTGYDRILWDNMLMYTLPYGRNIIGFSNSDAHDRLNIDTSFSVFMMEENNVENIKKTMQSGAFFCVTRILPANDIIGPAEAIDARNMNLAYPMFTNVSVKGHVLSVSAENADSIQWIANGKVIATGTPAQCGTLDLDQISGSEDFLYVRAELYGEGGVCLTQAFVLDDGNTLTYEEPTGLLKEVRDFIFRLVSTRTFTIISELFKMIRNKIK
ncbi:MAG: hypothetical protein PUC33_05520 [Oscillospiraceae bacterium]|nr:hypothetical protein [Oscillospiraceae bacterium]